MGGFAKQASPVPRTDFEQSGSVTHHEVCPLRPSSRTPPSASSFGILDRILGLLSWTTKPPGLLQEASIELGERVSAPKQTDFDPALQHERLTGGEPVPLAWLVATFTGCVRQWETTSKRYTSIDNRRSLSMLPLVNGYNMVSWSESNRV